MIALLRRFTALDRSRRALVLEAAALLMFVSACIRWLPFPTVRRMLSRIPAARAAPDIAAQELGAIDAIRWAITAVAVRCPAASCLVQALAADAMLRRRRFRSELRFGVRVLNNSHPPIAGHAWVACGNGATIGAVEDQSELSVLSPARPP